MRIIDALANRKTHLAAGRTHPKRARKWEAFFASTVHRTGSSSNALRQSKVFPRVQIPALLGRIGAVSWPGPGGHNLESRSFNDTLICSMRPRTGSVPAEATHVGASQKNPHRAHDECKGFGHPGPPPGVIHNSGFPQGLARQSRHNSYVFVVLFTRHNLA